MLIPVLLLWALSPGGGRKILDMGTTTTTMIPPRPKVSTECVDESSVGVSAMEWLGSVVSTSVPTVNQKSFSCQDLSTQGSEIQRRQPP